MIEMKGHAVPEHPMVAYMRGHVVATAGNTPQWITHLDGIGTYAAVEDINLSGPWRAKAIVNPIASPNVFALVNANSPSEYLALRAEGAKWKLGSNGKTPSVSAKDIRYGALQELTVEWTGAVLELSIDGVLEYTTTPSTSDWLTGNLKLILGGRHDLAAFLEGDFLSFTLKDLTLPAADQLVRDYRFDRNDGVVANYAPSGKLGPASALGDTRPQWTQLSETTAQRGANGAWGRIAAVDSGLGTHLVTVTITESTEGQLRLYRRSDDGLFNEPTVLPVVPGTYTYPIDVAFLANINGESYGVWLDSNTWSGTVDFKVRKATGWGTIENEAVDTYARYVEDSDGNLLGVDNLVSNGGFDTDTGWMQTGAAWSIANGKASCDGSQTASDYLYQVGVSPIGSYVRVSLRMPEYSAGDLGISFTNGGSAQPLQEASGQAYTVDGMMEHNATIYFLASTDFAGSMDNVKVQHLIPASDLYTLRKRIAKLLTYKAGKQRVIPKFDGVGMYGDIPEWSATNWEATDDYVTSVSKTTGNTLTTETLLGFDGVATYYAGYYKAAVRIDLDNPLTNSRLYLMDDATGILYDALAVPGDTSTQGQIVNPAPDAYPVFTYQGDSASEWLDTVNNITLQEAN